MKYYLCKPAEGPPRLENTQADAKAVDPKFVEHHVPDGKDERRDYVNALLAEAHPTTAPISIPEEKREEFEAALKTAKHGPITAVPARDVGVIDIMNRTAIEEALWASDERGLKNLEECIAGRRQELADKAAKASDPCVADRDAGVVNPPKRRKA